MTDHYPEIRLDIPDPAVTISYTTPLSNSIKDNVVSAYHISSCIRHSKMMSQPRSVVFNILVFTTDCEHSFPPPHFFFTAYWNQCRELNFIAGVHNCLNNVIHCIEHKLIETVAQKRCYIQCTMQKDQATQNPVYTRVGFIFHGSLSKNAILSTTICHFTLFENHGSSGMFSTFYSETH